MTSIIYLRERIARKTTAAIDEGILWLIALYLAVGCIFVGVTI